MIFIVALDPSSVEWAGQQGELGYDHLTGVLQCLLQNCFIAETESWRVGAELKLAVKSLKKMGNRKRVSALIETLVSPGRNRLYPVIDDSGFAPVASIGNIFASQTNHRELDLIVTEAEPLVPGTVETTKLSGFNQTNFARERSKRSSSLSFAAGSMSAEQLFRDYFRRLLLIGDELTVVDYMIGREFGGNFAESLVHWCRFLNELDKPMLWTIHTEPPQCRRLQTAIEDQLGDSDVRVRIVSHSPERLPHERYLRSAGICIDVGRGIDLFDRAGLIRDVRLGLGDDHQFTKHYPHLA